MGPQKPKHLGGSSRRLKPLIEPFSPKRNKNGYFWSSQSNPKFESLPSILNSCDIRDVMCTYACRLACLTHSSLPLRRWRWRCVYEAIYAANERSKRFCGCFGEKRFYFIGKIKRSFTYLYFLRK